MVSASIERTHRHRVVELLMVVVLGPGCRAQPDRPLTIAAAAGDTAAVVRLLEQGTPADVPDGTGLTPLVLAARGGHLDTLEALLARGADPRLPAGSNDWPPLVHAIHTGQHAAAHVLLDAGASATDRGGQIALLMAAGYGNAAMVRTLLARGADPQAAEIESIILADAVGGAWDIDHGWPGCAAHTETVHALLAAAPDLRLAGGLRGRIALASARHHGCRDLVALVTGRSRASTGGT